MPGATEIFCQEVAATDIWTSCEPIRTDLVIASPEWRRFSPADLDDVDPPSPEAEWAAKKGAEVLRAWMKENPA